MQRGKSRGKGSYKKGKCDLDIFSKSSSVAFV